MSGIYFPGIEMPKDIEPGLVIEFADGIDGKRYSRLFHYRHGGLTEWHEVVPVPPHGRLIDADALTKSLFHYFAKSGARDTLEALIRTEPTIIPAEELKSGGGKEL